MLYALGFIGLFTIGGLTGLFLAALGLDVHVHDTYFVVAHFHYIMVGGTVMGYLGGLHYWWPKITRPDVPRVAGPSSAPCIIFVGFNLTFFPQFILGYLGMPRRYHAYPPEFQVLNVLSSAGASILGVGYLMPMVYLIWSLRYGRLGRLEPVGRGRPRVDDDVAAADRELRRDAGRDLGRLRVSDAGGGPCCLKQRPPRHDRASPGAGAPLRQPRAAERGGHARDVGVPRHRGAVLRRRCSLAYAVYRTLVSGGVRRGQPRARRRARRRSTPPS